MMSHQRVSGTHSQDIPRRESLLEWPFHEWPALLGLSASEKYRVRQLMEWIFHRRVADFGQMSTLPQGLRQSLGEKFTLRVLEFASREISKRDGAQRLNFRAADGKSIPAVCLSGKEEGGERHSLCLSTQVGCAWGCAFCASGRLKFQRNLTVSEILGQVFGAEEATGKKVDSLLFMGMGEPLANYSNLRLALHALRSPMGFNYGARHVTVSTSGLVPQMLKLCTEAPKMNLAVSLHAADDETRRRLMPKAAEWPIKEVLKAAWAYQKGAGGGRVTFEYVLLRGINDSLRAAQRLSNLLRGRKAWVNLIPYNPVPGLPYEKPEEVAVRRFEEVLVTRGIFVRLRRPQGDDISSGCGQLGNPAR